MNELWLVETHGKPLQTVQQILSDVWDELEIDSMLIPLKNLESSEWETRVISSPDLLYQANPFTPIMPENIARIIPKFILKQNGKLAAALLRPCEVRAALEIAEKMDLTYDKLILISSDCLGTFPLSEFSWRAKRKETYQDLSEETLKFSRQGGIVPYRYRTACQLCSQQAAGQADLNIHIAGMPVRQNLLISASEKISEKLSPLFNGSKHFDQALINQHLEVSDRMLRRNRSTHARLSRSMVADTNLDLTLLVEQLNACGSCQACMEVCPICTGLNIARDDEGKLSRETIAEWMLACAGCGICEENCSQHKPLAAIFSIVKEQLSTAVM